jgi:hypothetical protein
MGKDLNQTAVTNYSDLDSHTIDTSRIGSVQDQDETVYSNDRFAKDWGYFMKVAKLHSAILMKGIWTVGKGFTCTPRDKIILDHVTGDGKQTIHDILFDMVVTKQAVRDSFAEIVRDEKTGTLLNLKIMDPSRMRIIYGRDARIKRYEQLKPKAKGFIGKIKQAFSSSIYETFKPEEIFHLSNNKLAGSMHGTSVPENVEKIILADDENFNVMQKLTRFQAVPFIIFKVKSDNSTTIATFKSNIKDAREHGEDLIVPDDENLLSWDVVQVNPSSILMDWRNSVNSELYRAVGMPLILFGSSGTTESGGKIEYLGHETVFEHDQLEIEQQFYSQVGIKINLNSPTSLLENLQTDQSKDAQQGMEIQQSDVTAGRGR